MADTASRAMSAAERELIGPAAVNDTLDDLTRFLGIELFVHPTNVQLLVAKLVGRALDRPIAPTATETLRQPFALIQDVARAFALEVVAQDVTPGSECRGLVRFMPQHVLNVPLLLFQDLAAHGQAKALTLLADLVAPGVDAFEQLERGLVVPLLVRRFRANALLRHYYDPYYMSVVALHDVFARVLSRTAAYQAGPHNPLLRDLSETLSRHFTQLAVAATATDERRDYAELAATLQEHATRLDQLAAAFAARATALCERKRRLAEDVLRVIRQRQAAAATDDMDVDAPLPSLTHGQ